MCRLSCAATAAIACICVVDQHHLGHTEARVCLQPTNAHANTTCTLHSRHAHAPQVHVRPNRPCSSSASWGGSGTCLSLACVGLWALTTSLPFLYIVVTTDITSVFHCVALNIASVGHGRLSSLHHIATLVNMVGSYARSIATCEQHAQSLLHTRTTASRRVVETLIE